MVRLVLYADLNRNSKLTYFAAAINGTSVDEVEWWVNHAIQLLLLRGVFFLLSRQY